LSKLLRNHLSNLTKSWSQPGATPSPESLQLHLDTRFSQLDVALGLDLSQEAFETIEDIHGLLTASKKPPKTQVLVNYYQKLAQLFWISKNLLFHAYASYKYYTLVKLSKTITPVEVKSYVVFFIYLHFFFLIFFFPFLSSKNCNHRSFGCFGYSSSEPSRR